MRPIAIAAAAVMSLAALALAPSPAAAIDCTPQFNWTCASNGYYNYLTGQQGGTVCGVDYTGWTLTVVNVTVTQGGWLRFVATAGTGPGATLVTKIILMDDCSGDTCVDSAQSNGVTELDSCLEVGSHTYVVATQSTAPNAAINMGLMCLTCAQAQTIGLTGCAACDPVSDEASSWGSFKARFN